MVQEVTEAKERLQKLEEDAAKILHRKPPADESASAAAFKTLEDAVRTLMVVMHASRQQLPTNVFEAVEVVATCLPTSRPSKDHEESSEDEFAMDEYGLMTELAEEESDEKMLEIAKRLRAKRLRVN